MEWPFHTFPPHRDDTLIPTLLLGRSRDIFDKQQHAIYKNKADFYFASTALIGAGSNIILPPMLNVSFLVNSGGLSMSKQQAYGLPALRDQDDGKELFK